MTDPPATWLGRVPALVVVVALGAGVGTTAGVGFTLFGSTPGPTFTHTPVVAFGSAAASYAAIPAFVNLPVPFTSQAPLGDWAANQHDCEEASLVMADRYLRGDHSGAIIPPETAAAAIRRMTPWKPAVDLTDSELGEVAKEHLGWDYRIYPATRDNIRQQLALGRPVIVGVRTHGLGNPNYPGYRSHYEQPAWSVSHYLVVTGYDASSVILNDPGITRGHGYHITFAQLSYAIADLDRAYPSLNQGQIMLVLAPPA